MKRACLVLMVMITAAALATGCAKQTREAERDDAFSIEWEFSRADDGALVRTGAVLVIKGRRNHRHPIGIYDGQVKRILSAGEIPREMTGGTISGFVTIAGGRGHEVIVRYDERLRRLIIMERPWHDRLPPGPFKTVHTIQVPDMHNEDTGF